MALTPGDRTHGTVGDRSASRRLWVESETPIQVMNLLLSPTGHVTNLLIGAGSHGIGPRRTPAPHPGGPAFWHRDGRNPGHDVTAHRRGGVGEGRRRANQPSRDGNLEANRFRGLPSVGPGSLGVSRPGAEPVWISAIPTSNSTAAAVWRRISSSDSRTASSTSLPTIASHTNSARRPGLRTSTTSLRSVMAESPLSPARTNLPQPGISSRREIGANAARLCYPA